MSRLGQYVFASRRSFQRRWHLIVLTGVLSYQGLGSSNSMAQSNHAPDTFASPTRPSADDLEDTEIQQVLDKNLPDLKSPDKQKRELAIVRIHRDLPLAVRKKHRLPRMETSRKLADELINVYAHTSDKDFSSPGGRRDILQTITLYGDDTVAKSFILKLLNNDNADERFAALAVIGVLGVTGDDVYNAVQKLAKRGLVKPEERTTLLVRVNKERALPEVLEEIKSSHDKKLVLYSSWALQEYYRKPEYYSLILPRLKALDFGKPNTFKNTNGLFWMDAGLFAAYLDVAQGKELSSALEFMSQHDEVRSPKSASVLIRKLDDSNPRVRILAADILSRVAADYSRVDTVAIRDSLRQALDRESDPSAKQAIKGALAYIERSERDWQWTLEQMRHRTK